MTSEHIERHEVWPHLAHADNIKTTGVSFEKTIATVSSVRYTQNGKWTCKFKEDTNRGNRYGWERYEGEPETPITEGDRVEVVLSIKNRDKGGYFYDVNFIRPVDRDTPVPAGMEERFNPQTGEPVIAPVAPPLEVPVDTSIPEDTPQPAPDHRPRMGAEWDEPPSFFHWKERGIQKMSALKSAVEFLAVHNSEETEALVWRLMNELADGKPFAQAAQEPGGTEAGA